MAKTFDQLAKRTMSKPARAKAAIRTRQLMTEMLLGELRKIAGLSQKQLAAALHMKQPSLSKLESQDDMQISTLQKIIEALGGRLIITAQFSGHEAELRQFGKKPSVQKKRRDLKHVA